MRVWSFDTATEEWQLSEVVIAWRSWHEAEMVELEFAGETVLATAAHPVWLTSGERLDARPEVGELPATESRLTLCGRWVEAGHLRTGDSGLSRTAGTLPVRGRSLASQPRWVYNFEVAGAHTYTVGSAGLLVHNSCAVPRKGSSRSLAANMQASGTQRPPGAAAHHIVASNAPDAKPARDVLAKFKIDIDDANNGVFLPKNSKVPNPAGAAVHSRLHSGDYFNKVNNALDKAKTREEALGTLGDIRSGLQTGRFP